MVAAVVVTAKCVFLLKVNALHNIKTMFVALHTTQLEMSSLNGFCNEKTSPRMSVTPDTFQEPIGPPGYLVQCRSTCTHSAMVFASSSRELGVKTVMWGYEEGLH